MATKIRFRRKTYGRGRTPSTREGWVSILVFLILFYASIWRFDQSGDPAHDIGVRIYVPAIVLVVALITLCYFKGEKPRWQRGGKPIKK